MVNVRVVAFRVDETPGAAEVVLGPGAADRRVLVVAVEVELDLALTPPAGVVAAPGQIRPDVLALRRGRRRASCAPRRTGPGCCAATARGSTPCRPGPR